MTVCVFVSMVTASFSKESRATKMRLLKSLSWSYHKRDCRACNLWRLWTTNVYLVSYQKKAKEGLMGPGARLVRQWQRYLRTPVFAAHDSIIHFSPINILTIVIVFCLFRWVVTRWRLSYFPADSERRYYKCPLQEVTCSRRGHRHVDQHGNRGPAAGGRRRQGQMENCKYYEKFTM